MLSAPSSQDKMAQSNLCIGLEEVGRCLTASHTTPVLTLKPPGYTKANVMPINLQGALQRRAPHLYPAVRHIYKMSEHGSHSEQDGTPAGGSQDVSASDKVPHLTSPTELSKLRRGSSDSIILDREFPANLTQ